MARIVLPVAGAVVGWFIGGPAGAQYGWMAGSIAGALVGSQTRKSVRAQEQGAQTTAEGSPRAIVYGAAPVIGNLIDTGPIRIVETTEEAKGGGGPSATTRTYFRSFAIRICEGPIAGVLLIKLDGRVIYDVRPGSDFRRENEANMAGAVLYLGGESQMPDPTLEGIHGAGNVPAHRGSAYMVCTDSDITQRQGSVPQYEFVVASSVDAEAVTLTEVASESVDGLFGGGTFPPTDIETEFDASVTGVTGTAFLAAFSFQVASGAPLSVPVQLRIGGQLVWSANVDVLTNNAYYSERVQINHALDSTPVVMSFTSGFTGDLAVALKGLPGSDPYHPLTPPTPGSYVLVEADDPDFGVVTNTTTWGMATFDSGLLGQLWRVDDEYDSGILTPNAVTLADIVEDIHDRCNASVPDVAELTDEVAGLVFASADYTGADAIETLRAPYFFDRAEYDGEIHYHKRGADSVATITFDDLVEVPDETQRESHPDYPRKIHLGYQAVQVNYELAQATSDRYSTDARVVGEQSLQVPVVLNEEQAANLVARMHKVAWADAEGEVRFSLPLQWIGLTPSENIDLDLRDRVRRLRIEKIEHHEGVLALTTRIDRQTAYSSEAPSFIPLPIPTPPPSTMPGETILAVMDISALRDVDDVLLRYVAVSSGDAGWRGAQLQRSLDDGASFESVQTLTSAAVIGTLTEAVAIASEHYTDTTNTVRVRLAREGQSIDSITDLAFVQRGGAFALEKDDGSWEIMQYLDAALDSDGIYTLSTLHRGLLNSTPSAHSGGSLFVLLRGARVEPAESAWIGADIVSRAPAIGQSPEDAEQITQTYVGRSQTEWPVASLALERDGADVITATWAPRHRLGTDVAPVASVNFQGYRVTIDNGSDGFETFDVTTPSFEFDATGFGLVEVSVQSLNRYTGPGPATTDAI